MAGIGVGRWEFDDDDVAALRHGLWDSDGDGRELPVVHVYLKCGHVLKLDAAETGLFLDHFSPRWLSGRLALGPPGNPRRPGSIDPV